MSVGEFERGEGERGHGLRAEHALRACLCAQKEGARETAQVRINPSSQPLVTDGLEGT